jgi:hypothetical protein
MNSVHPTLVCQTRKETELTIRAGGGGWGGVCVPENLGTRQILLELFLVQME